MRKFFIILFLLTGILFVSRLVSAVDCSPPNRCASCDACGYCWQVTPAPPETINPPQSWEACRNCLYPELTGVPASSNETVKISEALLLAPTTKPGRTYTMIGCINTNLPDFKTPGAAASLTTTLLNVIFSIIGIVAFVYFIYGTSLIITSQSQPEKLSEGRKIVYGALIGVIFSVSVIFIINFIVKTVLKIPEF
jgi:hypothetical protein